MSQKNDIPNKVSARELVIAAIAVTMLFVPIFMLKVHPDIVWVQDYLGGGRVMVFWLVGTFVLHSIEKFFRKRQGRDESFTKFKERK